MKFVRRFYKNLYSKYRTLQIHFAWNLSSHLPKQRSLMTYANVSTGTYLLPQGLHCCSNYCFPAACNCLLCRDYTALQLYVSLRCLLPGKVSHMGLNGGDGFFTPLTVEVLATHCAERGCCHLLRATAGSGAPDYTSLLLHTSVAFV